MKMLIRNIVWVTVKFAILSNNKVLIIIVYDNKQ